MTHQYILHCSCWFFFLLAPAAIFSLVVILNLLPFRGWLVLSIDRLNRPGWIQRLRGFFLPLSLLVIAAVPLLFSSILLDHRIMLVRVSDLQANLFIGSSNRLTVLIRTSFAGWQTTRRRAGAPCSE
jgi:hypothetical protein